MTAAKTNPAELVKCVACMALAAAALILSACGPAALPLPAKRPVSDSDVIGRWRYFGDFKTTTIVIEFTPDHKFAQTITGPGGVTKTQQGSWNLDGANLHLSDVLLNDSVSGFSIAAWTPRDSTWWFTDETGSLELMGGERSEDPDQCWPLEKLSPYGASKGAAK
jgi:hypothetical protein